jgi:hypothetical protein
MPSHGQECKRFYFLQEMRSESFRQLAGGDKALYRFVGAPVSYGSFRGRLYRRHAGAGPGIVAGLQTGYRRLHRSRGPYDFPPLTDPVLKIIFGPPSGLARTQPINFVTAGLDDRTVDPGNTRRLPTMAAFVKLAFGCFAAT